MNNLAIARPHMHEMIIASRAEQGCIAYSYSVDLTDSTCIHVNERWETRHALDRHLKTEHIKRWRAVWKDIGISDRSLRLYSAEPENF